MKKVLAVLTAVLSCGMLFGCADNGTSTDKESSKTVVSQPVDISKGATEQMIERSILFEGDTTRLANKLNHIKTDPKDIMKICFMGDSITEGSLASTSANQYTNLVKKWWEENLSYYVEFSNAGIGGTTSHLGVHRLQKHVLDEQPDIIFVEFINDTNDEFYKSCMDSLIRKCLSQENQPAVIMIEMTLDNGDGPQEVHSEIAKAYGVPVISYHDAVMPEIKAGNLEWKDISPDNVHPNDDGHALLAQLIENYIQTVNDKLDSLDKDIKPFDAESPTGDKYVNARLCDRNSDEVKVVDEGNFTETASFNKFDAGWKTTTKGSAEFKMEFQNLGIAYLKTTDGRGADVTITVDGEQVMPISGNFYDGWGDYLRTDELYTSDKSAEHTVKISVDEGDATDFQILSWLLS